jgi:cell division GTPase FtsZ
MSVGVASGENRISQAVHEALHSPLVNSDVRGATRLLLQIYTTTENALIMSEIDQIHAFVSEIGEDVEVQWGASLDETLGDNVRVTIIATGFEVSNIPGLDDVVGKKTVDEAIKIHYEDTKVADSAEKKEECPESPSQPVEVPLHINKQPIVPESGDIVIDFEDDLDSKSTSDSTSGLSAFGWMRGRK